MSRICTEIRVDKRENLEKGKHQTKQNELKRSPSQEHAKSERTKKKGHEKSPVENPSRENPASLHNSL